MLAKKLHLDPALMASPLFTAIVDACSVLLYFEIACRVLNLAQGLWHKGANDILRGRAFMPFPVLFRHLFYEKLPTKVLKNIRNSFLIFFVFVL